MNLRVGTRRSPLALTQTRQVLAELQRRRADVTYELVEIVTTGDRILDRPLREAGGKGLFLKELDEALVGGRIDCAVHSMKDVPTDLAPGTAIAAVPERADARDLLVTVQGLALAGLGEGAVIGTTSLRRQAQALAAAPGVSVRLLRGNVGTRLAKLAEGHCDATFLAAAGLGRLGFRRDADDGLVFPPGAEAAPVSVKALALDPFVFVPAPGQGALALTAREDDAATRAVLAVLDHPASRIAVEAERAFARVFGGGCHLPLAAHAVLAGERLELAGLLVAPDGSSCIRDRVEAELGMDPATAGALAAGVGAALARSFFERGAASILEAAEAAGVRA